eukprot:Gregarina_sp_Poly_1__699@NODE_1167_length_4875_cov_37_248128_g800_i0_p3_GENE_NODE_1167_length_4875_cov_37_248128_g800_i0NODE_1167_length_4875_cov_37_248128_g800_i0_p3_ORF_typecomplete_len110_score12_40_NODE_1167_length_4875_cov_37_248128_g800_i013481677
MLLGAAGGMVGPKLPTATMCWSLRVRYDCTQDKSGEKCRSHRTSILNPVYFLRPAATQKGCATSGIFTLFGMKGRISKIHEFWKPTNIALDIVKMEQTAGQPFRTANML